MYLATVSITHNRASIRHCLNVWQWQAVSDTSIETSGIRHCCTAVPESGSRLSLETVTNCHARSCTAIFSDNTDWSLDTCCCCWKKETNSIFEYRIAKRKIETDWQKCLSNINFIPPSSLQHNYSLCHQDSLNKFKLVSGARRIGQNSHYMKHKFLQSNCVKFFSMLFNLSMWLVVHPSWSFNELH